MADKSILYENGDGSQTQEYQLDDDDDDDNGPIVKRKRFDSGDCLGRHEDELRDVLKDHSGTDSDVGIQFTAHSTSSEDGKISRPLSSASRGFELQVSDPEDLNEGNDSATENGSMQNSLCDTQKYDLIGDSNDSGTSGGFVPLLDDISTQITVSSTSNNNNRILSTREPSESHISSGLEFTKIPSVDNFSAEQEIHSCDDISSQEPGTSSSVRLGRVASLHRDAANISSLLDVDSDIVYHRLKTFRDQGNRVDIVSNEILENGIEFLEKSVKSDCTSASDCDIFELVDYVMKQINDEVSDVSPDEVFSLLEKYAEKKNRGQYVVDVLKRKRNNSLPVLTSEAHYRSKSNQELASDQDSFKHVQYIQEQVSGSDPNDIYLLFEKEKLKFSRTNEAVESVIKILKSKSGHENSEKRLISEDLDEEIKNMPLFKDLETISAMFPDKDKNEIYAYLEAHYHNKNRIQVVTDELLRLEHASLESDPNVQQWDSLNTMESQNENPDIIIKLQEDLEKLRKIFPDCDPDYLFNELETFVNDSERTTKISAMLFEKRDYPKLKKRLEESKVRKKINKLRNLELDIDEFLMMFPNPVAMFYDEDKQVDENYQRHALEQLLNDFPMITNDYIEKKLQNHHYHYLPTMKELQKAAKLYRKDHTTAVRKHKRFLVDLRPRNENMPETPSELFYREALFCRHEEYIIGYIKQQEDGKRERRELAALNNELLECACCYSDDVLIEDMLACPDGHIYCSDCVRHAAEENIAQSKSVFPCIDADCDLEYSMGILQKILSPNSFSIMLRRKQDEEIQQAGIDDLVSCPFCTFATIMSNPDDKILKCLNPECLKESCRLCREENHIPLRCDEVERESERSLRAFIEKRMNEAMIRQCWKCKKNFYKIEGCNKMTCVCGAHMCYICRQPIKGYDHFQQGNCGIVDSNQLHIEEMKKAAADARAEYERDHPEVTGQDLKFNPLKHIPQHTGEFMVDDNDGYGDDDDDDDEGSNSDDEEYDDFDENIS